MQVIINKGGGAIVGIKLYYYCHHPFTKEHFHRTDRQLTTQSVSTPCGTVPLCPGLLRLPNNKSDTI